MRMATDQPQSLASREGGLNHPGTHSLVGRRAVQPLLLLAQGFVNRKSPFSFVCKGMGCKEKHWKNGYLGGSAIKFQFPASWAEYVLHKMLIDLTHNGLFAASILGS